MNAARKGGRAGPGPAVCGAGDAAPGPDQVEQGGIASWRV
jgi:hypothetical protein